MQKFVTIYLDAYRAERTKLYKEPLDSSKRVMVHLQEYLNEGREVKALEALGYERGGWFGVVLEKN